MSGFSFKGTNPRFWPEILLEVLESNGSGADIVAC